MDRESFRAAYTTLHNALERRRKKYRAIFFLNLALAAAMLVAGVIYPRASLTQLAQWLHHAAPISAAEVASFTFFCCVSAAMLICTPLVRYRGGIHAEYAIDRLVLTRICEWLGECSPAHYSVQHEGSARASRLFPADAGIAEIPGIRGSADAGRYFIQEMAVSSRVGGRAQPVFRGLFMYYGARRKGSPIVEKEEPPRLFALTQLALDKALDDGLTLHAQEALLALLPLAERTATLETAAQPVDARIWHKVTALLATLKELFTPAGRHAIRAEVEYDAQFCKAPVMAGLGVVNSRTLFEGAAVLSLQGKVSMLAIPAAPLWNAASLFQPVFSEKKALLLYDLVAWMHFYAKNMHPVNR